MLLIFYNIQHDLLKKLKSVKENLSVGSYSSDQKVDLNPVDFLQCKVCCNTCIFSYCALSFFRILFVDFMQMFNSVYKASVLSVPRNKIGQT